jgi:acetyl-CoA C-acetyltransferase
MLREIYLAGAVRTAIGGFGGAFASISATALGSIVIKAALTRAGVPGDEVREVIFGNVISAGLGQNPARQAAIGAGLSPAVGATTINKVCGSSLKTVMLAAQAIQCADAEIVVAGGTENMSRAPYLLERARTGYRMGHGELVDAMVRDGLWDAYTNQYMGNCGELCAAQYHFTREQQDDFAITSFTRALAAGNQGRFTKEIVPVDVKSDKQTATVQEDETPKKFNEEKLRKLKPTFEKNGTITAGNASSINDGAAAVVALSAEKAKALGVQPQARILGYSISSREPQWFTLAPIQAMESLMKQLSWKVSDVDLFEINEAFAVVPMAAMKDLAIPHEKVNVNGGAVALGHPIGASGTRTLVTLIHALEQRGLRRGIASLCVGGGEGVALAVERI